MTEPRRIFYDESDDHRRLRTTLANRPNLYLAGKIRQEVRRWGAADWIKPEPDTLRGEWGECAGFQFIYTGPFVEGTVDQTLLDHRGSGGIDIEHNIDQRKTFDRSIRGVLAADIVVASIDTGDAYGTIFEIGHAFGRTPVVLILPTHCDADLWFPTEAATAIVYADSPGLGLEALFVEATAGRYGGHSSYDLYLKSEHWQSKRAQALLRAGSKCQLCGSTDELNVHHNSYDRLGGRI